ncbi:hypothetical protein ACN28S_55015 [Cystobacter fuscus]
MGDLETVLEEQREELLRRWSEALHRSLPRAAPGEPPSPSELFELLHGLTRALGEHPASAGPPTASPWLSRGDPLPLALAVYESLGEAVTDLLQEEGGVLSPGEARVLTRFITSGLAAAGAPRESSRVTEGRLLPEASPRSTSASSASGNGCSRARRPRARKPRRPTASRTSSSPR